MEITLQRTLHIIAGLLLAAAATQAVYTALHMAQMPVPRQVIWGLEGVIFTLLAAFAGSAMVMAGRHSLGFAAIMVSAAINIIQVGAGLTMFGPFSEVAGETEALAPMAGAVVAFSFMIYNAAKMLLGLAALVFGMAAMKGAAKALGIGTALAGGAAMVTNAAAMAAGRDVFGALPLAGGSGVIATVLLAVCLFGIAGQDQTSQRH